MILPKSLAAAFVACASVRAGSSPSLQSATSSKATTIITRNSESVVTASTSVQDMIEITTVTSPEPDVSSTTILSVTETSAAIESNTAILFTTTSQDFPTTVTTTVTTTTVTTTTTAAMTISQAPNAPSLQCADLDNLDFTGDKIEYELYCNWIFDCYAEICYE